MRLYNLFANRCKPPKPSTASFDGQTILITAATGGLGLEAAKKLAVQGTSTLIITARDEKKGAVAQAAIEAHLKSLSPNPNSDIKIIPLVLEMSEPSSIDSFITDLKSRTKHLDHAILNAGLVTKEHTMCNTGYETVLQVNTISTTLLALLLLPLLLASPLTTQPLLTHHPHLTFISSGTAWSTSFPQMTSHIKTNKPLHDLSAASAFPAGTIGAMKQYGRSKLLLEHLQRRLAYLPALASDPSNPDSDPKVLVSSTCPGMCRSDLGRQHMNSSWVVSVLGRILMFIIAKSASAGANCYITSLEVGGEGRGEMWKADRFWVREAREKVGGEEGRRVGEMVWREMREYVERNDESGVAVSMLAEKKDV